jgi:nitroimidazol reductase NimA-like FMN-containing flavoprotein (pyridoxamine 5'-phosphate oxidase superfamily)
VSTPPARPSAIPADELGPFLSSPLVARLALLDEHGYPYIVPVWYEYDGEAFWILAQEHVRWVKLVQQDPRCALSVAEDVSPFRRAMAQGQLEIVEGPPSENLWPDILRRNAIRYRGPEAGAGYVEQSRHLRRYVFRLRPERLTTFRGFRGAAGRNAGL